MKEIVKVEKPKIFTFFVKLGILIFLLLFLLQSNAQERLSPLLHYNTPSQPNAALSLK